MFRSYGARSYFAPRFSINIFIPKGFQAIENVHAPGPGYRDPSGII